MTWLDLRQFCEFVFLTKMLEKLISFIYSVPHFALVCSGTLQAEKLRSQQLTHVTWVNPRMTLKHCQCSWNQIRKPCTQNLIFKTTNYFSLDSLNWTLFHLPLENKVSSCSCNLGLISCLGDTVEAWHEAKCNPKVCDKKKQWEINKLQDRVTSHTCAPDLITNFLMWSHCR